MRDRATELKYFKWMYFNSDFGPADSDVRDEMVDQFMEETHMDLPKGYNYYSDGETCTDIAEAI